MNKKIYIFILFVFNTSFVFSYILNRDYLDLFIMENFSYEIENMEIIAQLGAFPENIEINTSNPTFKTGIKFESNNLLLIDLYIYDSLSNEIVDKFDLSVILKKYAFVPVTLRKIEIDEYFKEGVNYIIERIEITQFQNEHLLFTLENLRAKKNIIENKIILSFMTETIPLVEKDENILIKIENDNIIFSFSAITLEQGSEDDEILVSWREKIYLVKINSDCSGTFIATIR